MDLGSQGREFVTTGPSVQALAAFSGDPATTPIRVCAGPASDAQARDRAVLIVKELDRTGAFDWAVLCVMTATGTGWTDPRAAASLEYLWNGDTALATMQYAYLPSWLSFLVDSSRARQEGGELFKAVYERWASLPEDDRPVLLVFGESLGADGSEAAFSGVADLRNRTDGVLWVGPPRFSELWSWFTERRPPGTPERLPVFRGGRQSGSPPYRNTSRVRTHRGTRPGSFTFSMPPIRSCGGRRDGFFVARTGWPSHPVMTCCRR